LIWTAVEQRPLGQRGLVMLHGCQMMRDTLALTCDVRDDPFACRLRSRYFEVNSPRIVAVSMVTFRGGWLGGSEAEIVGP